MVECLGIWLALALAWQKISSHYRMLLKHHVFDILQPSLHISLLLFKFGTNMLLGHVDRALSHQVVLGELMLNLLLGY
jgi:hypothetical protein